MQIVFDETLYGIAKSGSVYEWRIYVAHNEDDTGTIHISRGLIDGKKHTTQETFC